MRKVIYAMSVSVDGFIEAADGDLSWSYPDEELHGHFNDQEAMIGVHLYGRGVTPLLAMKGKIISLPYLSNMERALLPIHCNHAVSFLWLSRSI